MKTKVNLKKAEKVERLHRKWKVWSWLGGWVGGWTNGWMGVKAVLKIAYS